MKSIEKVQIDTFVISLYIYNLTMIDVERFIRNKMLDVEITDDIYILQNWKYDVLLYRIRNTPIKSRDKKVLNGSYVATINKHRIYMDNDKYSVMMPDSKVRIFRSLEKAKDFATKDTRFVYRTHNGTSIVFSEKDLLVIKSALKDKGYKGMINNKINRTINRLNGG